MFFFNVCRFSPLSVGKVFRSSPFLGGKVFPLGQASLRVILATPPSLSIRVIPALLLCFFVASAVSCADPVDRVTDVKDLRVLAIQAEPPELLAAGTNDTAEVTFTALVVDPRGEQLRYNWEFCPYNSSTGCLDLAKQQQSALNQLESIFPSVIASQLADILAALHLTEAETTADPPSEAGEYTLPPLTVSLAANTPGVIDYAACGLLPLTQLHELHGMLEPLKSLTGTWPSAVLKVVSGAGSSTSKETTFKRVNLTTSHPGDYLACMQAPSVIPFCESTDTTGAQEGDCIPLNIRQPNANPVFDSIEIAAGRRSDTTFMVVQNNTPPYQLKVGEVMRIKPVFTDASYESYQALVVDFSSGKISAESKIEELSVSWFATGGTIKDELTWPKYTRSLDTIFTAPDVVPSAYGDALVHIWMVARDLRGGVAWKRFDIEIIE